MLTDTLPRLPHKAVFGLGIAETVLSSLIVILGIVTGIVYAGAVYDCSGATEVWMGIGCIVAGAIGVVAGKTQRRPFIVANMVMSITASVFAFIIMCIAAVLITPPSPRYNFVCYFRKYSVGYFLFIIIALLAAAETITAIVSACMCCRVLCCGPRQPGQTVATHTIVRGQPTTGVVVHQGAEVNPPVITYYGQPGVVSYTQPGGVSYTQPGGVSYTQSGVVTNPVLVPQAPIPVPAPGAPPYTPSAPKY